LGAYAPHILNVHDPQADWLKIWKKPEDSAVAGERGRKLITELLRLGSVDKDIILCFSAVAAERVTKLITEPFKTKVRRQTHYMLSSLDILSMCHTDCRPGTKEIRAKAHSDPKESWSGSNMRDRHDRLLHNGACYKQYRYSPVNRKLHCRLPGR
jgi:hypothetical protein